MRGWEWCGAWTLGLCFTVLLTGCGGDEGGRGAAADDGGRGGLDGVAGGSTGGSTSGSGTGGRTASSTGGASTDAIGGAVGIGGSATGGDDGSGGAAAAAGEGTAGTGGAAAVGGDGGAAGSATDPTGGTAGADPAQSGGSTGDAAGGSAGTGPGGRGGAAGAGPSGQGGAAAGHGGAATAGQGGDAPGAAAGVGGADSNGGEGGTVAQGGAGGAAGSGPCDEEIQALSAELYQSIGSCTVVVRLDHDTLTMIGYQVVCGSYSGTTEAEARATAQSDTGYGQNGQMLNEADPADQYVFYEAPGDFGGAAAVSAHTGLSVFGGSIIWMGTGEITYPDTWRDPAELGSACPPVGASYPVRGYDLVGESELDAGSVSATEAVVATTAVPAAFRLGGSILDVVVLRYPRSVGAFNPSTAEWIVLFSGGWLE